MNKTIFKKIIDREVKAKIVYEDDLCLCFADINPQAPTHLLVIPKEHIASQAHAEATHAALLGHLLAKSAEIARTVDLDRGYRVVINTGTDGGQTVNHLHLHLLGGRYMAWPPG